MIAATNMSETSQYHQSPSQISLEMSQILAAQKDPKAFEPLYKAYYSRLVSFAYHRLENKEDAFEIASQVFYKALQHLGRYKPQGLPFSSWLFRIASNEINQYYRRSKARRVVSFEEDRKSVV